MGRLGSMLGAIIGGAAAGAALRARQVSRERDVPLADVVAQLPELLQEDLARVRHAARGAIDDGLEARREREEEIERDLARVRSGEGNT